MKTQWEYNKQTELRRIIFTAERIKNLFYQKNGFIVTPYCIDSNPRNIYFPDYDYSRIEIFWEFVPNIPRLIDNSTLFLKIPNKIQNIILPCLSNNMLSNSKLNHVKSKWEKVQKQFYVIINSLFNVNKFKIIIRPTKFGSLSSYFCITKTNSKYIYVYFRVDQDIAHLAEVILTAFIEFEVWNKKENEDFWNEKETTTDFLFKYTKLGKLFPNYTPTMMILKNFYFNQKSFNDSQNYLRKLGYGIKTPIKLEKDNIILNGEKVRSEDFSREEKLVLFELIRHRGNLISFDKIADLLWGKSVQQKFSPWAIAKKIEIIRKKFREYGLNYNVIKTYRKKGYMLIS